jgi:hypothetical protein
MRSSRESSDRHLRWASRSPSRRVRLMKSSISDTARPRASRVACGRRPRRGLFDVSEATFVELRNAASVGHFVSTVVKPAHATPKRSPVQKPRLVATSSSLGFNWHCSGPPSFAHASERRSLSFGSASPAKDDAPKRRSRVGGPQTTAAMPEQLAHHCYENIGPRLRRNCQCPARLRLQDLRCPNVFNRTTAHSIGRVQTSSLPVDGSMSARVLPFAALGGETLALRHADTSGARLNLSSSSNTNHSSSSGIGSAKVRVAVSGLRWCGNAFTPIFNGTYVTTPLDTHVPVASIGIDSSVTLSM